VNGSWFIFDLGFYPWYGYPYDYYYGYPYGYDGGVYDSAPYEESAPNYDNNDGKDSKDSYDSSNQNGDSSVAAAQERLSKQGYYRGQIDGVFGAETSRAIMRFQGEHGLRETGNLTMDTRRALGLGRETGY
jgi:peptidoglycan hydrolase-like protein with peptidoglycan-binding domain